MPVPTHLVTFIFSLLVSASITAQQNIFLKQNSAPGEKLTIKYGPATTPMFGIEDFNAYAYLLEGTLPVIQEVALKKEGKYYTGEIKTNDTTKAVLVKFVKDGLQDDNNSFGYSTLLYTHTGQPVPGARHSLANALNGFHKQTGIRNREEAKKLLAQEFKQYPASRQKYKADYWRYLRESTEEADKNELRTELEKVVQNTNASEADLAEAMFYFERALIDSVQVKAIDALIKNKFPDGIWKYRVLTTDFLEATVLERKENIFSQMQEKISAGAVDDQAAYDYDHMASTIARAFSQKDNYDKALEYAAKIKNKSTLANTYNAVALRLAGNSIDGKPVNAQLAKELSNGVLNLQREEMNNLTLKPTYYTEAQWKDQQDAVYYTYANTYAIALYHNGEKDQAYEMQQKSVENLKGKSVDANRVLTALAEKVKGPKEAQTLLEKFITEGRYNAKMIEQLKRIYLAQNNAEGQWETYYSGLKKSGLVKTKEGLAKKMINTPAPGFTLKDLKGNSVSLASLKGKVVVVDFWATWCGPCIASFPGMQKAVDHYKADPDVVFLFIDTWEKGNDREEMVSSFIEKNKYTFNVLYDVTKKGSEEFIVINSFKVDGIPTKFVIDRSNNIRFKSVGYKGDPEEIFNEVSLMIELTKEKS